MTTTNLEAFAVRIHSGAPIYLVHRQNGTIIDMDVVSYVHMRDYDSYRLFVAEDSAREYARHVSAGDMTETIMCRECSSRIAVNERCLCRVISSNGRHGNGR